MPHTGAPLTFNQRAAIAAKLEEISTDPNHPVFIDYDDEGLDEVVVDSGEAARVLVDVVLEAPYVEQVFTDAKLLSELTARLLYGMMYLPDVAEHNEHPHYLQRYVIEGMVTAKAWHESDAGLP